MSTEQADIHADGYTFEFVEDPSADDFRGSVNVTAHTEAAAENWLEWHDREKDRRRFVQELDRVAAGEPMVRKGVGDRRDWYRVPVALDWEYCAPYYRALEQLTGYGAGGEIPEDMDLTRHIGKRLCHTRIVTAATLEGGHPCALVWVQAQDWSGRPAHANAEAKANRYWSEEFAHRPLTPEFIFNDNGTYSRNPKYGTGHMEPLQPALQCEWFWEALFGWWIDNRASDQQRAMLDAALGQTGKYGSPPWAIRKGGGAGSLSDPRGFYIADPEGNVQWNADTKARLVTWEEFRAL